MTIKKLEVEEIAGILQLEDDKLAEVFPCELGEWVQFLIQYVDNPNFFMMGSTKDGKLHIIFLDVIMPGIDGYEACKRIKRDPETKHIPVVLLTGCSTRLDRVKGKMSGCDTYLVKPVSKDEFYQTLRKHLAEKATVR